MKIEVSEEEFQLMRKALIMKMAFHVKAGMTDMKYESRQRHVFDADKCRKLIDSIGDRYVNNSGTNS